jgi:hypothetical protein
MLRGEFPSAGTATGEALRGEYDEVLAATVDQVGVGAVADETGIGEAALHGLPDGESPDLSLAEAAAVLATDPDRPDADTLLAEARDILLMGMSAAVLDVEAVAAGIEDEMEPKEIQQKVEGRHPMSLDEYARLHAYIEGKKP